MLCTRHRNLAVVGVLAAALLALPAGPGNAASQADARSLVAKATATLDKLRAHRKLPALESAVTAGQAVVIIPEYLRVGLGIGGEGGSGVMLRKDPKTGSWSYPAFYRIAGGSVGLQIGVEQAEVVLVLSDDRLVNRLIKDPLTLGADATVVAGDDGASSGAFSTGGEGSWIRVFAVREGAFIGATLKGGVLRAREDLNVAYYGEAGTPDRILNTFASAIPEADRLRTALARISASSAAENR